jgi:hypothetical protein
VTYLNDIAMRIKSEVPSNDLPEEDTEELFVSYAVLLLAKGEDVTREDVHNAWVAWMEANGKEHESMIPFAELPPDTQAEDSPFVLAIRSVARSSHEQTPRSSHNG